MINVKLQHFRDAMQAFRDDFILIGGNACALLFDNIGAEFRETADLDIVLVIEKWSPEFAATLDQYIMDHGYTGRRYMRGDEDGKRNVHRFSIDATHRQFHQIPNVIELFSRCPDGIVLQAKQHLIPIEAGDRISNFSAILFDDDYYAYLNENTIIVDGVRVPHKKCLTALKASAWINNKVLFNEGTLNSIATVHKHAFDICRLFEIYENEDFEATEIPSRIIDDIKQAQQLFQDKVEVAVLDQFLAATNSGDLPISFEEAAEFLGVAFIQ